MVMMRTLVAVLAFVWMMMVLVTAAALTFEVQKQEPAADCNRAEVEPGRVIPRESRV